MSLQSIHVDNTLDRVSSGGGGGVELPPLPKKKEGEREGGEREMCVKPEGSMQY